MTRDYYITPTWCVERMLDLWAPMLASKRIVDPCAGDGQIARAVRDAIGGETWAQYDIEPRGDAGVVARDTLAKPVDGCEACVMNPPFSHAFEYVATYVNRCPIVIALVRLSFLGSIQRHAFFSEEHPPRAVQVLSNRPSFDGLKTDSAEYCWVLWDEAHRGATSFHWAALTDATVRRDEKRRIGELHARARA